MNIVANSWKQAEGHEIICFQNKEVNISELEAVN